MKSQTLLSLLLLFFTSLSAAWPGLFEDAQPGALKARQNSQSQAQSTAASQTGSASGSASGSGSVSASASASATSSSGNNDNKSSGSGSASASGSGSKSGSSTATSKGSSVTSGSGSRNSTKTAVDPRLPPGGVSMMTPAATDGMTFVKVGDQVTFRWNYTSLSFTPSYIDVIATNTVNSQTYTIAGNQSVEATQQVVWDTNQFTQTTDLPFVVATYTLMIYDANSEPTAVASAGYLNAFSNLQFGVYTPQAYTPLNEFRCSTCNSAMSLHEKQALGILLGTCTITILSFTWFASGVFHLF